MDGIHLSEAQARSGSGARLWRRTKRCLLTVSSHGRGKLGGDIAADAIILAAVFPTASHPGRRSLGALRFAELARGSRMPVIALGGVTATNARKVVQAGADGIAAIGGLS